MKVNIIGIPSSAGALYKGTEKAPKALRDAGLIESLKTSGLEVEDKGDILGLLNLPRHNISPVRNWPAPRMVWESIAYKAEELFNKKSFTILIGGDCSIEVGTFTAFRKVFGESSHLLVLDGHIDTVAPKGAECTGAAGMGLWFLAQDNRVWWEEEPIKPSSISVVGTQSVPENSLGINILPLWKVTKASVKEHLDSLPQNINILAHLDVDVLNESIMPAAYSPSKEGLDLDTAMDIMKLILSDKRVKGIEITEFDPGKDDFNNCAKTIIKLISLLKYRV